MDHSGSYVPSQTVITLSNKTVRMQQVSSTNLLSSMFSSQNHGTGTITEHDFSQLIFNQPTPNDGGKDARLSSGNGRRPVYGQQYPRGYYNK